MKRSISIHHFKFDDSDQKSGLNSRYFISFLMLNNIVINNKKNLYDRKTKLNVFFLLKISNVRHNMHTFCGRLYLEIKILFAQLLLFSKIHHNEFQRARKKVRAISKVSWNEKQAAKSCECK